MPGLGQNELLSMSQQFSGLPMDSLIGGPLNAAATANGTMAVNQVKFMLDSCFIKKVTPGTTTGTGTAAVTTPAITNYDPIMINMSLTRQVITPVGVTAAKTYATAYEAYIKAGSSGTAPTEPTADVQNITTAFTLPLLTIIPLNSLAVKTVNIDLF